MTYLSPPSHAPTGGDCVREAFRLPRRLERGLAQAEASYAVACALDRARPDDAPPDLPIVVAAGGYSAFGGNRFVARHDDPGIRMAPVDSTALEPSGILQAFIAMTGWAGPSHLITSDHDAQAQALAWARATLALGHADTVLICEVTGVEPPDFGAVAATLWTSRQRAEAARPSAACDHARHAPPEAS
ncbi:hypothetical protein [Nonomuraea sp. NPDC005650]|uniref:hypothetical protein n=1 Tax=Nonomuraea sp. NPDC005650 TaxID=3157045 RepID=UPI0033BDA37C